MQHQSLTDEYRDHLLLYALGELDAEAAQEVTAAGTDGVVRASTAA